jgi:undecaprenyl diphosphate synthase
MDVVKAASDLGIKTLTVYAFSTENWGRSEKEVNALMDLFELSLIQQREAMLKNGVRLHQIGDITSFSPSFIETLEQSKTITADGKNIDLVLALNYGGRDEIRRAFQVIAQQCCDNKLKAEDITEETITDHLDTAQWPDPKLLIRTSGEKRISNFLLWQLSYTEVIFSNTLWPDFSPHTLLSTLLEYQQRTSRRGI